MSSITVVSFTKASCFDIGEVQNAFRGAIRIWARMEEKYLPPVDPKRYLQINNESALNEIFDLVDNRSVDENDRICLVSTFDWVLVNRENIDRLVSAFRAFDVATALTEEADIIEKAIAEHPDIVAIGFEQTSCGGNPWTTRGPADDKGNGTPYKINEQNDHFELFEALKEEL